MKNIIFYGAFLLCTTTRAQLPAEKVLQNHIDSINRLIDQSVVEKRMDVLQRHYADDFVFTHGTGTVDSKSSWLKNVADPSVYFVQRRHDSTHVELHPDLAIITGTLSVGRKNSSEIIRYALRYVRVYALRNQTWQLLSHRTTAEWHY